ncbi:hypothetical protein H7U34_06560 [Collinsella tanakaei]|nr:hypothetical protein [Collinsella tanakaei]
MGTNLSTQLARLDSDFDINASLIDVDVQDVSLLRQTAEAVAGIISPLTAVGMVARQAIQTFGLASVAKRRVKAVKYVADAEVMKERVRADARMRELAGRHLETVMYIDRKFQMECDRIMSSERRRMAEIESAERVEIERLRSFVRVELERIDKEYSRTVQDQETLLKGYRDFRRRKEEPGCGNQEVLASMAESLYRHPDRFSERQTEIMGRVIVGLADTAARERIEEFVGLQNAMAGRAGSAAPRRRSRWISRV